MPCPFLSRLSPIFVRNYYETLLHLYGCYCPAISEKLLLTYRQKTSSRESHVFTASQSPIVSKPEKNHVAYKLFSFHKTDNHGLQTKTNDIDFISKSSKTSGQFLYDKFFNEQIIKKKKDHSYRIFRKVNRLGEAGMYPYALECTEKERPITVWCSNDYLGMSCHPKVKNAVYRALQYHGAGAGGTRNISGNSVYHEQLEYLIAQLHQKESALLFTSCFVANDSTLFTLAKMLPNCHIFSDSGNHASMIQGICNSKVPKHIFRHNDVEHLKKLMKTLDKSVPKIVAFETVHSMSGEISPLKQLIDVSHEYGGITFIDEVHAVGLYGDHGAGIGELENQLENMDIISGTLGKAFGNIGGYIAGSAKLIDMIRSYAAGFIFTTSLPPTVLFGAIEAINILSSEEGRDLRMRHQSKVKYLKYMLQREGFPVEDGESHIIPVRIGNPVKATLASDFLMQESGHYIQAINYPTVARGEEKLRLAPTPFHTFEMINTLIEDMKKAWSYLELPINVPTSTEKCFFCNKKNEIKFGDDNFCNEFLSQRCPISDCPKIYLPTTST